MTIATTSNSIAYTGDAVSLAFAFPYPFIATTDLKVYLAGVLQTTGYSVAGIAPTGGSGTFASGTVTFTVAPAAAAAILIYCDPDLLQSTSIPANDPFPAKTVEKALDKLTLLIQRIYGKIGNALTFPLGDTANGVLPSAAARANMLAGFDSSGNVAVVAAAAGTATALTLDLASTLLPSKNSGLVGFNPALNYVAQTIGYALLTLPNLNSFTSVDPTGAVDSTAAIQAAITLTSVTIPAGSTYKISAPIVVPSNRTIQGCGATSLFKSLSGDISQFTVTSASGVTIRNIGIQATNAGTTSNIAAIKLDSATDCTVENCDISGVSNHGVYMRGAALRNRVRSNYFHGFQGTVQDASDVAILSVTGLAAPAFNSVTANYCYGTSNEHGVLIQDPYTLPAVLPQRNTVEGNFIGQHTGYGVIVYQPNQTASFTASIAGTVMTVVAGGLAGTLAVGNDVFSALGVPLGRISSFGTGAGGAGTYNMSLSSAVASSSMLTSAQGDSHNKVALNHVEDAQGSYASNRDSGAGIYIVGAGAGGTLVNTNTVRNCCVQTLTASLAPAGIGVNGIPSGCAPVVVEGNVVTGMTQFHGIQVAGGNTIVKNNSVTMPATNVTGVPFKLAVGSNVTTSGNTFTHLDTAGASTCALLYANGGSMTGVTFSDNQMIGGGNSQVSVTQAGGFTIADLVVNGNRMTGAGTGVNAALYFSAGAVISGTVSGNLADVTTAPALAVAGGITNVNFASNRFQSSGTVAVSLAGTCTGCVFDQSNTMSPALGMLDTSTGFYKEVLVSAVPAAGTWAQPARFHNTTGTVGQPKGWRLTTAGTLPPGTGAVTSEGNL